MKKTIPYFLLFFGLIVLFLVENVYVAGLCLILGLVMIMEQIWPSVKDK